MCNKFRIYNDNNNGINVMTFLELINIYLRRHLLMCQISGTQPLT